MSGMGFVGSVRGVNVRSGRGSLCRMRRGVENSRLGSRSVRCMAEDGVEGSMDMGAIEGKNEVEYVEYIEYESDASVQRRKMQAITLGVLNLLHLFAGLNSIIAPFVPDVFFGVMKGSIERVLIRFWGCGGLLRIATILSLKSAAENNRLESATYKRLSIGLAISSIAAATAILTVNRAILSAHLIAFSLLNAFTGIVGAWIWISTPGTSPISLVKGVVKTAATALNAKKLGSKAFGLLAILCAAVFVGGTIFPAAAFKIVYAQTATELTSAIVRGFVSSYALLSSAFFTLSDALDRDRLSATTFRHINTGIAGGSIILYVLSFAALRGKPPLGSIVFAMFNITIAVVTTYYFIKLRRQGKPNKAA